MKVRHYLRIATGLATGTVGTLLLSGVAYPSTASAESSAKQKTEYLSIEPASLKPASDGLTFNIGANPAEAESNGCLIAGVHLPDHAKIAGVTVFYAANIAGGITFAFDRDQPANGHAVHLARAVSDNSKGFNRNSKQLSVAPTFGTVNNKNFSYAFTVCFAEVHQKFYGARVQYTVTAN